LIEPVAQQLIKSAFKLFFGAADDDDMVVGTGSY
jgi:hypothetical protein